MTTIRCLTDDDRAEVRALWKLRFDDTEPFLDFYFSERWHPESSICAEMDGRIVSVMQGTPMKLRIRDRVLPAMMVSGVSTLPGYEKRGLMHIVFTEMLHLCRRMNIPLVFDHPADATVYESLGHLYCTRTKLYTSLAATRPALWTDKPDSLSLYRCYSRATVGYSCCTVRSFPSFRSKLREYFCDGGRCLALNAPSGETLGYCIAFPAERGVFAEELLAVNDSAYHALLARLPAGSRAKLPPDAPAEGELVSQNVMGVANVRMLIEALVRDESYVFRIHDPVIQENNGVFDGLGRLSDRVPAYIFTAGELIQHLCGYRALDARFPALDCFCVDEF